MWPCPSEGLHYWLRWREHVGAAGATPVPEFVQCGMLQLKVPGSNHERAVKHFDALGVPYEDLDAQELERRFPHLDARAFGPPARMDDDRFWTEPAGFVDGAVWMPEGGYVTDPMLAAQNLAAAAAAFGGDVPLWHDLRRRAPVGRPGCGRRSRRRNGTARPRGRQRGGAALVGHQPHGGH